MKRYKEYELYFDSSNSEKLLRKIIDKNYSTKKEYKNDRRTYVAKIEIENKEFIIKKIYLNKVIKKFLSFFKQGEGREITDNSKELKKELKIIKIYGSGEKRKNKFLKEEIILMEYIKGEVKLEDEYLDLILEEVEILHKLGRYHGDCNPYNFLVNSQKEIFILDSKLKKMSFGNYRAHYDMLTFFKYFSNKPHYPYRRNIYYYLALGVRKIRNLKNFYNF